MKESVKQEYDFIVCFCVNLTPLSYLPNVQKDFTKWCNDRKIKRYSELYNKFIDRMYKLVITGSCPITKEEFEKYIGDFVLEEM